MFDLTETKALIIFLTLAILKIGYMLFYAIPIFHLQTNELVVTAAQQLGTLPYDPTNIGSNFYHNIPTLIPNIELFFLKLFHGNYTIFLYTWCFFGQLIFCLATFAIGRKISQSNWGGLLCFTLCNISWFTASTIGYGFMYFAGGLAPGMVMQGVGIGLLALALYDRWKLFFLLLGLSFNLHPIISAIILCFAVCYFLITKPHSFKFLVIGVIICLLLALPTIFKIHNDLGIKTTNIDWSLWWTWMKITKLHHVFPWHYPMKLYGYLSHLLLFTVLITYFIRNKILTFNHAVFAITVLAVATALLIFNSIAVEYLKIPFFASAMLQRATVFTIPITCALIATWVVTQFKIPDQRFDRLALATFVLIILFTPIQEWDWQIRVFFTCALSTIIFCLYQPKLLNKIIAYLLCIAIVLTAFLAKNYFSLPNVAQHYIVTAFLIMAVIRLLKLKNILLIGAVLCFTPIIAFAQHIKLWNGFMTDLETAMGYNEYLPIMAWFKQNAPRDAQILVPPIFNKADIASNHVILPDGGLLGIAMYKPALLKDELTAMKVIYGYDLTNPNVAAQLNDANFRSKLQQHYDNISVAQINSIKKTYPLLRYVVFDVSTTPKFDLPYKIVTNTPRFIVYDLQKPANNRIAKTILSLDKTWLAVQGNLQANTHNNGVTLISNKSLYDYQLASKPLKLNPQKLYQLVFNGKIISGQLNIGLLVNNTWYLQKTLPANTTGKNIVLTAFMLPTENPVTIILANNNSKPQITTAQIKYLALQEITLS